MSTVPQWNADIVTPSDNVDVAANGGLGLNEGGALEVKVDNETIVINQDGELQATLSDRDSAYVATYGTTTYQELSAAHTAGKAIFVTGVSGALSAVIPMTSFSTNPAMVMFSSVIAGSEYRAKIDQDVWSSTTVSTQADWNESNQVAPSYIANKPTVDQIYDSTSTNAQSGTAVAGAIAGVRQVPSTQSADESKVLGVTDANGTLGWVSQPSVPASKPLVAGSNITITNGANDVTIAASDTTYTFSTGLTESSGTVTVANPVPTPGVSDSGKVLTVTDANGNYDWAAAGGGDIVFVTLDTGMSSAEAETLFNTISAAVSGGKRVIGVRESSTPPVTIHYQYPLMWLSDNSMVYDRKAIFTAVYYNPANSSFQMESYAVGALHVYNEYVVEFANSNGGTGQH